LSSQHQIHISGSAKKFFSDDLAHTEGMTRADLCAAPVAMDRGPDTAAVADDLVALLGQDRLHYVELGPEPVKTSALIGYLLEHGWSLRLHSHDSIMLRKSRCVMRSSRYFHSARIQLPREELPRLERHHIELGQDVTLITMLGFQEGNELPAPSATLFEAWVVSRPMCCPRCSYQRLRATIISAVSMNMLDEPISDLIGLKMGSRNVAPIRLSFLKLNITMICTGLRQLFYRLAMVARKVIC